MDNNIIQPLVHSLCCFYIGWKLAEIIFTIFGNKKRDKRMGNKYKKGDKLYRVNYGSNQVLLQSCYIKNVHWSEQDGFSYWVQEGSLSTNESENNLFRSIDEFNKYFTEDKKLDYLSKQKKQFEAKIKEMNYYIANYQETINRYEKNIKKLSLENITVKQRDGF